MSTLTTLIGRVKTSKSIEKVKCLVKRGVTDEVTDMIIQTFVTTSNLPTLYQAAPPGGLPDLVGLGMVCGRTVLFGIGAVSDSFLHSIFSTRTSPSIS